MAEHGEKKMNHMTKITDYDKENDILFMHKGFSSDEKFKGNIDVGDLILDISTKGRIRGIEIMNAASYLKEFRIESAMLENIKEAEFNATIKPNSISIGLLFKSKNMKNEIPAKIAISLEKPLLN